MVLFCIMDNKKKKEQNLQDLNIQQLQYEQAKTIPSKPITEANTSTKSLHSSQEDTSPQTHTDQQIRLKGAELAEMVQKNKQLVQNCMAIVRKEKPRAVSCVFVAKEKLKGKPKYSLKVTSNFF